MQEVANIIRSLLPSTYEQLAKYEQLPHQRVQYSRAGDDSFIACDLYDDGIESRTAQIYLEPKTGHAVVITDPDHIRSHLIDFVNPPSWANVDERISHIISKVVEENTPEVEETTHKKTRPGTRMQVLQPNLALA